jgi:4-amino-4-deoxy-L-arabinose transferase-like glycosyltransferase
MTHTETAEKRLSPIWIWLTVLFVLVMFFGNLGSDGIYAAQEGRTAIIARNMLRSGDYAEMRIPGGILYEKPILHYWIVAGTGALFGLDGDPYAIRAELAVRLPSAVAALLAVLAAALLAKSIYGEKTALVAAAALSGMATFNNLGRLAHIDMLLAAAFVWAMAGLYFGYLRDRRANAMIYVFYLALAVGVLLKGPAPVILAGLTVLALMIRDRDWKLPLKLRPFTGVPLLLVLGGSWYVFETIRTDGAFFEEFIMNQNIRRFTGVGSAYRGGERMSLFYYVPKFFAGALPWSIAAVALAAAHWRRLVRLRVRRETFFLLAWLITGFAFFSCSALKRGDYLLPLYPALAILSARGIVLYCDHPRRLSPKWRIGWMVLTILALAAVGLNETGVFRRIGEAVMNRSISFVAKSDGLGLLLFSEQFHRHLWLALAGLAAALALLWYWLRLLEQRRAYPALVLLIGTIGALFTIYNAVLGPALDEAKSVKTFVREARAAFPPGATVVICNGFNTELLFFLDHPYVMRDESASPYVVAEPSTNKKAKWHPDWDPERYEKIVGTPELHQYPVAFYRAKTANRAAE